MTIGAATFIPPSSCSTMAKFVAVLPALLAEQAAASAAAAAAEPPVSLRVDPGVAIFCALTFLFGAIAVNIIREFIGGLNKTNELQFNMIRDQLAEIKADIKRNVRKTDAVIFVLAVSLVSVVMFYMPKINADIKSNFVTKTDAVIFVLAVSPTEPGALHAASHPKGPGGTGILSLWGIGGVGGNPSVGGCLLHPVRAAGGAGGATADALLSRAEQAGTTVDREIEEMDRELQRQVAEFRKQQRRDSQPGCEEPSPEAEAPAPCPPSLLEPENAELRELKDLAAKMDEAFPEGEGAAPQPPSAADEAPDAEPEDTEVSEFKNLLDQLDLRLRALQSKEALKLPLDEAPASVVPKAVTETLESLRSQLLGIGVDTSLHSIPREKRMSFHDTHKVYSRLEAMKVAKEQALVRERAADYTKDGREVPRELLSKYKKQVALKLDQSGQRRKGERRTSGMENPKPAPPALEPPPAAGTNGQRLPQAPPPGNPPANPPAAAGIPTMPGLPAAHYAWPPPGQGGPTPRMPQTTTGFTGAYQPYGLPAQGQTPGRGDGLPRYPLPPGPSLFTPPSLSPPVGFPPPVLPQSAAVPPSVDQKDQMQKLFEEVLQKQHNALILRLESWLSKLDSKLDELPPRLGPTRRSYNPTRSADINDRGVAGVRLRATFMSITVEVSLLSGKTATVQAGLGERVETLKRRAQVALGGRKGRLLDASGVVLDGRAEITNSRIQNGDSLTLHISSVGIQSSGEAFAAILGDASVVSWGDAANGGDSSAVQAQLQNVQQIQATDGAFAAVCSDGSVVTWGNDRFGGDSSAVQGQLKNVQHIQASVNALAAILGDGSVVTWGNGDCGGDSSAVQDQLKNVQQIQASSAAFAAILGDGSVVTWGSAAFGGDSSSVQGQLKNVQQIQAVARAFAALLGDGSVVTWGRASFGGDSGAVQAQLRNVQWIQGCRGFAAVAGDGSVVTWGNIQASGGAFAAILSDGSVVTWGNAALGGDSSAVQGQLKNVQQIQACRAAFAAVCRDGSVVTWGQPAFGGNSSAVQGQLKNVLQIRASRDGAFAALLGDGCVVTWGHADAGGDSSVVQGQLKNVQQIQASHGAFAAIVGDGSVVSWGNAALGGDSSAVQASFFFFERQEHGSNDPDKVEEKPQRRSIHSEDYELAQSEADRIESMKLGSGALVL
ncbi:HERC1 [Symbiodinium sp. KB8]|nr:HERC1 [Symbiodinium sp. KB8]